MIPNDGRTCKQRRIYFDTKYCPIYIILLYNIQRTRNVFGSLSALTSFLHSTSLLFRHYQRVIGVVSSILGDCGTFIFRGTLTQSTAQHSTTCRLVSLRNLGVESISILQNSCGLLLIQRSFGVIFQMFQMQSNTL